MNMTGLQYKTLVKMAKKHCARDNYRPALQGIMVSIKSDEVVFTACDGYRAMCMKIPNKGDAENTFTMPIFSLTCKDKDLISIKIDGNNVKIINLNNLSCFTLPRIEGDSLDVETIIQNAESADGNTLHLNPKYAADAFSGIAPLIKRPSGSTGVIKLHVPCNEHSPMHISAKTDDVSYESIVLPVRV